ncbi:hypothetical protein NM688_g440 [Phlebia brevispora]|uniref:Uncharacterized protein n=1 Tax=Phlebia brevispora TaxID=194682 RepID=A0ACC1TEC7_9APHY|nr:hypothetical protein NM688_g440 [Phlebia brevispora]
MSSSGGPTNATQAKDRNYMQLGHCLARLSRAVGQTADLCELLKVNLDSMKVLSATHAAQFMTIASQYNTDAQEDEEESGTSESDEKEKGADSR